MAKVIRLFTFQATRICEEDRCDGVEDCPRESGDTKSFDEQDCPTYPDVTFAPPTSSKLKGKNYSLKKLSISKIISDTLFFFRFQGYSDPFDYLCQNWSECSIQMHC